MTPEEAIPNALTSLLALAALAWFVSAVLKSERETRVLEYKRQIAWLRRALRDAENRISSTTLTMEGLERTAETLAPGMVALFAVAISRDQIMPGCEETQAQADAMSLAREMTAALILPWLTSSQRRKIIASAKGHKILLALEMAARSPSFAAPTVPGQVL